MTRMFTLLSFVNNVKRNLLGASKSACSFGSNHPALSTETHGAQLTDMIKCVIPVLSADLYKGQCGRIGVVGGCKEYTGAPYFGAISALKLGADLSHVFCTEAAAPVIKSYSPELIVHPILDSANAVMETSEWLPRLHALIVGPGLGREPLLLANVKGIINEAMRLSIPLVIDADGVFLLSQDPGLIKGYPQAILTPNAVEFNRLFEAVIGNKPDSSDLKACTSNLSRALGHVTVVRKGPEDIISDGNHMLVCSSAGNPRRCGGQGDLLAGSMGVFSHWAHTAQTDNLMLAQYGPTLCAAYAACNLTRECGHRAYTKYGRATMTTNMIDQVQMVFEDLYG